MKLKTLLILAAMAALLGALAYYSAQIRKPFSMPSAIGSRVLPDLAVNRIGKLVITSRDGVAVIAKSKDKWVVASRFNYPANFDKVADTVRELSELKVGQTVNVSPSQLDLFNLIAPVLPPARLGGASGEARPQPGPAGANRPAEPGTLVELRDEKDGLLASLIVGKSFMRQATGRSAEMMMDAGGYPDGQYVRSFDGKVYLVSKTLDRLTEPAKTWLADDFIDVSPADIKEITVSGPGRAPIELVPAAPAPRADESFVLKGLRPEEGRLDASKVNQMTGALNRLGFDDVADPALPLKDTGLDRPVSFRAVTKDGLIYEIRLGNTLTNDNFDRYFSISVTNEPAAGQLPAEKAKQETDQKEEAPAIAGQKNVAGLAAEFNGKFAPWVYIMKSYRAEPILLARDDLIKKPEPSKAEGATNAPVIKAEETGDKSVSDQRSVFNEKTKDKPKK